MTLLIPQVFSARVTIVSLLGEIVSLTTQSLYWLVWLTQMEVHVEWPSVLSLSALESLNNQMEEHLLNTVFGSLTDIDCKTAPFIWIQAFYDTCLTATLHYYPCQSFFLRCLSAIADRSHQNAFCALEISNMGFLLVRLRRVELCYAYSLTVSPQAQNLFPSITAYIGSRPSIRTGTMGTKICSLKEMRGMHLLFTWCHGASYGT